MHTVSAFTEDIFGPSFLDFYACAIVDYNIKMPRGKVDYGVR